MGDWVSEEGKQLGWGDVRGLFPEYGPFGRQYILLDVPTPFTEQLLAIRSPSLDSLGEIQMRYIPALSQMTSDMFEHQRRCAPQPQPSDSSSTGRGSQR